MIIEMKFRRKKRDEVLAHYDAPATREETTP